MEPEESALFRPVETKRASEVIFEQVLNLIRKGELKPGDRLPSERHMMEMFQRSRPTVREALRMLERGGYIRTSGGSSGAVVLAPDGKSVENYMTDALSVGQISLWDLSEYRRVSEMASAAWAAERRDAEDLRAMEEVLAEMESVLDSQERFSALDSRFHGTIAHAAKNQVCEIFNRSFSRLSRSFVLAKGVRQLPEEQRDMNRRVHEMHLRIYEAIRDGDAERAREAMRVHMDAFRDDLKDGTEKG